MNTATILVLLIIGLGAGGAVLSILRRGGGCACCQDRCDCCGCSSGEPEHKPCKSRSRTDTGH